MHMPAATVRAARSSILHASYRRLCFHLVDICSFLVSPLAAIAVIAGVVGGGDSRYSGCCRSGGSGDRGSAGSSRGLFTTSYFFYSSFYVHFLACLINMKMH